MKHLMKKRLLPLLLCGLATLSPVQSGAEDIDIYVGPSTSVNKNPKVLVIIENSSNWSRASQQWPGGLTQGQSEARALQTFISGAGLNVDIGLMEYATAGSGNAGGFIRKAVTILDTTNQTNFSNSLTTIFNNITDPNEKVNSTYGYGDLMWSAYNYFSGTSTVAPSSTVVSSKADSDGYTANYTTFKSPLSDSNACARNFVVFIGNNGQGAIGTDGAVNGNALVALGGSISPQLQYNNYTTTTTSAPTTLGYTSQCYSSLATCSTADYATQCVTGGAYGSCTCTNTTTTNLDTCSAGQQRYAVYGNTLTAGTTTTSGPTAQSPITNTGGVSSCYATSTAASSAVTAASDTGGFTCPAGSTSTSGNVTTTTTNSCAYALVSNTPSATATQNCAAPAGSPVLGSTTTATSSATTTACYGGISTGSPKWNTSGDNAGLTCPATSVVTAGNTTTTTTYTCTYGGALAASCAGSKNKVLVTQTATGSPSSVTSTPSFKYDVKQIVTPSIKTVTTSGGTTTQTLLGNTSLCYASSTDAAASTQFTTQCSSYNSGCTGGTPTASAGLCSPGARYLVTGNVLSTVVTPTGTTYTPTDGSYADEWARFMHQETITNAAISGPQIKQNVTTFTIDVYNAQQNAAYTALLQSMANAGGGQYFAAKNEQAILDALKKILAQIQSVNSTFASASLPVNATNRTQNANQVFIGMFRPDPDAKPRWFGNLKQYAIGRVNGSLDLVDSNNKPATNALTGFVDDCATSFWTTDSGNYWINLAIPINPDPSSNCATLAATALYSDAPDGPTVEKGAVAEVLRKGNDPSATTATYTFNRNMLTSSSSSNMLSTFNATSSGLSGLSTNNVVGFAQGKDVNNDTGSGGPTTTTTRPSIHGDVVHSRPLPINYGTAGVTVYYGANDGTYRAIDATTAGSLGKERWSYIAPEFYSKLQRQKDNLPLVSYPNVVALGLPNLPKDYFFDGSTGIYQNKDSSKVWIYPTQRRGGRMIYGFDVSTPSSNPILKWRHGCPNLTDDTGCTTGGSSYSAIGQTWSTPNVAFIRGFSTTTPILLVGGGYDNCEDQDVPNKTGCGSAKGRVIYVINADTGDIINSFTTLSSVAADVSFIDINNDGYVDYAYAADTGGNIYRIDFIDGPGSLVPLASSAWVMRRVAYTNSSGRKFLFTPGLFASGTTTYVALTSGDRERPLITNYPYTTPVVNRAYVYKDNLSITAAVSTNIGGIDLDGATMLNFTSPGGSTCSSASLLSTANALKNGWYLDLTANGTGEQGVTSSVIVAGMVTFSTNRPLPASAQSCGSVLGEARGYFVNLFNASGSIAAPNNASCGGDRSSIFAGGGLPPSPVIGIVPIDGQPTAVLIGAVQRDGTNSSPIKPSTIVPPITQVRTRTYKSINSDK